MKTIQEPVTTCAIWHAIQHYAFRDAIFLAERLHAEVASSEALLMLATAYYHSGKPKVTKSLLESQIISRCNPECKLLYAQACWDLDENVKVESAILGWNAVNELLHTNEHTFDVKIRCVEVEFGDSACYALSLLGRVMIKTERRNYAEQCFKASLRLNAFLWTSFEYLCKSGSSTDPKLIFTTDHIPTFASGQSLVSNAPQKKSVKFVDEPKTKPLTQAKMNIVGNTKSQSTPTSPAGVTPSTLCAVKSNPPMIRSCNRSSLSSENAVLTPSPTKVGFGAGDSGGSLLKDLQSSAILSQETSALVSPTAEFFRSTPGYDATGQWDSSMDSLTSSISSRRSTRSQQRIKRGLLSGPAGLSPLTPSFGVVPLGDTPSPERLSSPDATAEQNALKMTTRQSKKSCVSDVPTTVHGKLIFSSTENNRRISKIHNTEEHMITPPALTSVRRSNRINANTSSSKENAKRRSRVNQSKYSPKKNTKSRQVNTKSVRDLSEEIRKANVTDKLNQITNSATQALATNKIATESLMHLLLDLGQAYKSLCDYKCSHSVAYFNKLSQNQLNTPWVLSNLGRAYFEMNDYEKAEKVFGELRMMHPYYMEGLEIYSTTLWHLKKEHQLSSLAHEMKDFDHLAPQTWCAVGNCFSLQQDHISAATFLHRSVQLDSKFEYAHTLLGHELATSDDLNGALSCFRSAIKCSPRHYNAWYGIGSVYFKQEKYALAEIHFRKALAINPNSSVLLCHIGMVENALKKTKAALRTINAAVALEPRNPLTKFHRASVLISADQNEEALIELNELLELVPKESVVYFLRGKVYKKMGKNHLAMSNFSWARDLDPKGTNNQIKEAINKYNASEDESVYEEPDALLRHANSNSELDPPVDSDDSDIRTYFETRHREEGSSSVPYLPYESDDSL